MEVDVDGDSGQRTDRLADTVDYSVLAETIVTIGAGEPHRLLESLARRMLDALEAKVPGGRFRLELRKLNPPSCAGHPAFSAVRVQTDTSRASPLASSPFAIATRPVASAVTMCPVVLHVRNVRVPDARQQAGWLTRPAAGWARCGGCRVSGCWRTSASSAAANSASTVVPWPGYDAHPAFSVMPASRVPSAGCQRLCRRSTRALASAGLADGRISRNSSPPRRQQRSCGSQVLHQNADGVLPDVVGRCVTEPTGDVAQALELNQKDGELVVRLALRALELLHQSGGGVGPVLHRRDWGANVGADGSELCHGLPAYQCTLRAKGAEPVVSGRKYLKPLNWLIAAVRQTRSRCYPPDNGCYGLYTSAQPVRRAAVQLSAAGEKMRAADDW